MFCEKELQILSKERQIKKIQEWKVIKKKWKYFRKTNIVDQVKNSELNKKVAILATKAELKAEEGKITKIQVFGLS